MKHLSSIGLFLALLYPSSAVDLPKKHGSCRKCSCTFVVASPDPKYQYSMPSMSEAIGAALAKGNCSTITNGYTAKGGYGFSFEQFHNDPKKCNAAQTSCSDYRASGHIWRLACHGKNTWSTCMRHDDPKGTHTLDVKIYCDGCKTVDCAEQGRAGPWDDQTCCAGAPVTSIDDLSC